MADNPFAQHFQDSDNPFSSHFTEKRTIPESVPQSQPEPGDIAQGVKRGLYQAGGSLARFGEGLSGAVGLDSGKEFFARQAESAGTQAQEYAPKVGGISDVNSVGSFADYLQGIAAEQVPNMGLSLGGALAGAKAGASMVPGALKPVGGLVGGALGAFVPSYALNTGELYGEQRENNVDNFGAAAKVGLPMAALDVIVPGNIAEKVISEPVKGAFKQGLGAGLKETAKAAGTGFVKGAIPEGATELGQEELAIRHRASYDPSYDVYGPEANQRRIEALAAGGLVGGVTNATTDAAKTALPEGPLTKAANAAPDTQKVSTDVQALGLPNLPQDEIVTFKDGSQARRSDVVNYYTQQGYDTQVANQFADNLFAKTKQEQPKTPSMDAYFAAEARRQNEQRTQPYQANGTQEPRTQAREDRQGLLGVTQEQPGTGPAVNPAIEEIRGDNVRRERGNNAQRNAITEQPSEDIAGAERANAASVRENGIEQPSLTDEGADARGAVGVQDTGRIEQQAETGRGKNGAGMEVRKGLSGNEPVDQGFKTTHTDTTTGDRYQWLGDDRYLSADDNQVYNFNEGELAPVETTPQGGKDGLQERQTSDQEVDKEFSLNRNEQKIPNANQEDAVSQTQSLSVNEQTNKSNGRNDREPTIQQPAMAIQPEPQSTPGQANTVPNERTFLGTKNPQETQLQQQNQQPTETKQRTFNEQRSTTTNAATEEEATPQILTTPKNKYIANRIRQEKIKRSSPGYEAAKTRIENEYEVEVDKAQASLSFEQYKALPENKGLSDDVLKQAHEQLKQDHPIQKNDVSIKNEQVGKVNKNERTIQSATVLEQEGAAKNKGPEKRSSDLGIEAETPSNTETKGDTNGTQQVRESDTQNKIKQLKEKSKSLYIEAKEYNKSTNGRAVKNKGRNNIHETNSDYIGPKTFRGPSLENSESAYHRSLVEKRKEIIAEIKKLESSIKKEKPKRKIQWNARKIQYEKGIGNTKKYSGVGKEDVYVIKNINNDVLDALGYKKLYFKPGEQQEIYAETKNGFSHLYDGDVNNLITFINKKLNEPKDKRTAGTGTQDTASVLAKDSKGKSEVSDTKEKIKYHPAIETMANDLVVGGGISIDKNKRRNKSLNPDWYKDNAFVVMSVDGKKELSKSPSVGAIKTAVKNYTEGKKLTKSQERILEAMSDIASYEETLANEQLKEEQKYFARELNALIVSGDRAGIREYIQDAIDRGDIATYEDIESWQEDIDDIIKRRSQPSDSVTKKTLSERRPEEKRNDRERERSGQEEEKINKPKFSKSTNKLSGLDDLEKLSDRIKNELNLKSFVIYETNKGDIELASLIVSKDEQKKGNGTKAVQKLVEYADKAGKRLVLTPGLPNDSHGTTSRGRLVKFYKRFGFVESKGRNIDYELGAGKMYRDPKPKFSKSKQTSGSTIEQIKALLPRRVNRLVNNGVLNVVQSVKDLPKELQGAGDILGNAVNSQALNDVEALYDSENDKLYLVADMLNESNINSVLNHELYHRAIATDTKLQNQLETLDVRMGRRYQLAAKGKATEIENTAFKRVMASNTPLVDRAEEFQAYLVSEYNKSPESFTGAVKKWFQDLYAAIRAALIRHGIFPKDITPADLNALAMYGAKFKMTQKGESVKFSKGGNNSWKNQPGFDDLTEAQFETLGKIGKPPGGSFLEEAKTQFDKHRYLWAEKLKQGVFDQYDSFKSILNDKRAWMMANISNTGGAVTEAAIEFGKPFLDESGAVDVDTNTKSLGQIFEPLGEEVDRFLMWIAGNRADRLSQEDRERLFSDIDINNLKSLSNGKIGDQSRISVYQQVRKEFEDMHNAIVKIGVDTGLVSREDAAIWEDQGFYVPFYRLAEDETTKGPVTAGGLVKQQAYKKLKGADMQLNDLLSNTLMNWNHLVNASLKNQAATKALESAVSLGLAQETPVKGGKKSVFIRKNGKERWFDVVESQEGELILDSLNALNWAGLNNPAMKVMRKFKRALTVGVTASPEFKIANLLRDSIQAIAVSDMSANIAKNLRDGFKYSAKGQSTKARMIAGGGAFGDSGYIHGADPDAIKLILKKGLDRASILDTRNKFKAVWDKYQDFGARLENVNRMANFEQALEQGKDLLTANFEARDQLDFQRTGSFLAVRAMSQMIPFLNARLQGINKLGRSLADEQQRKQFGAVVGSYAAISVLMYLLMKDDDDYQKAEQWERDTYHLFKVPGGDLMYRIPRPFEVGAIANMIERAVEQMADDKVHGELFVERLKHALTQTLSIDVVPQALKPINEIWANKSSFTGREIESQAMQNLSKTERRKAWTSQTAIGLSNAMDSILWDEVTLSPIQVEHLVNGYLGWMGATTLAGIDLLARPAVGAPDRPELSIQDYPVIGRFARETNSRNSRFITEFYEKQKEMKQVFNDIKRYREEQEFDKASRKIEQYKDDLRFRRYFNRTQKRLSDLNKQITLITNNKSMSPEVKRRRIDRLNRQRVDLAQRAVERLP